MPIATSVAASLLSPMNGNPPGGSHGLLDGVDGNLPQALQNLQRILQSQLANVNPLHLQQALQRQQVRTAMNLARNEPGGWGFVLLSGGATQYVSIKSKASFGIGFMVNAESKLLNQHSDCPMSSAMCLFSSQLKWQWARWFFDWLPAFATNHWFYWSSPKRCLNLKQINRERHYIHISGYDWATEWTEWTQTNILFNFSSNNKWSKPGGSNWSKWPNKYR